MNSANHNNPNFHTHSTFRRQHESKSSELLIVGVSEIPDKFKISMVGGLSTSNERKLEQKKTVIKPIYVRMQTSGTGGAGEINQMVMIQKHREATVPKKNNQMMHFEQNQS